MSVDCNCEEKVCSVKSDIARSCKMLLLSFFLFINCFWIYAILVQGFLCLALTQFLMEIKIICTFKSISLFLLTSFGFFSFEM